MAGAPKTLGYPLSTQVPQVGLPCKQSLHYWVLPQWILIKPYLEKHWFNTCDGNTFLKNGFKVTVAALWKYAIAYPGGKVLFASEMWICAFQSIRLFIISVTLILLFMGTCVCLSCWFNGRWWERNGQIFLSDFLTCKCKLQEKFLKRGLKKPECVNCWSPLHFCICYGLE